MTDTPTPPTCAPQSYRVRHGGLMRCCLATLDEFIASAALPPAEGDTLRCQYETRLDPQMRFRDGAWEWTGAAS